MRSQTRSSDSWYAGLVKRERPRSWDHSCRTKDWGWREADQLTKDHGVRFPVLDIERAKMGSYLFHRHPSWSLR